MKHWFWGIPILRNLHMLRFLRSDLDAPLPSIHSRLMNFLTQTYLGLRPTPESWRVKAILKIWLWSWLWLSVFFWEIIRSPSILRKHCSPIVFSSAANFPKFWWLFKPFNPHFMAGVFQPRAHSRVVMFVGKRVSPSSKWTTCQFIHGLQDIPVVWWFYWGLCP